MERPLPFLDETLFPTVLQAVPCPIVVLDADARIQFFNRAAEAVSGYASHEVLEEEVWFLLDPADRERAMRIFRALFRDQTERREGIQVAWLDRHRVRRPLSWATALVRDHDDEARWLVCTATDLTRLVELEDRARRLVAEDALRRAREDALRSSEARFSGIVQLATDAIVSVNDRQEITLFNRGAETIFGWSAREVVGKPLETLLPERLRERHREYVRRFGESGDEAREMGERQKVFGRRRDGREFPAEASIIQLDVGGERVYTVVLRDISHRQRSQLQQRFLLEAGKVLASSLDLDRTLSNLAELAVGFLADYCAVDLLEEDGSVRRIQVAAAEGTDPDPARTLLEVDLDRTRPHLVHATLQSGEPELVSEVTPAVLEALSQGPEHKEALERTGIGSFMAVPLRARDRMLGALLLIASRERGPYDEEDLQLAVEVGLRAGMAVDSAGLYRDAQRAVQARDDIMGIVSHDLGNPLQAIFIGLEALERWELARGAEGGEDGSGGGLGPAYYLSAIRRSADLMERLIQELLEVRRMEEGYLAMELEERELGSLVHEALELVEPLARVKRVELLDRVSPESLPALWLDGDRVLQVLSNLVGNAVKHTPEDGRVVVEAVAREVEVQLSVRDSGPGIPPDDREHVFERFWRAEKTGGKGIGLGLAIAKGIVRAHGGRIWVESELGAGSTFHFTLPRRSAS